MPTVSNKTGFMHFSLFTVTAIEMSSVVAKKLQLSYTNKLC